MRIDAARSAEARDLNSDDSYRDERHRFRKSPFLQPSVAPGDPFHF